MSFAARPIGLVKSAFVFDDVITSDVTNYNLRARAVAAGWDQVVPLIATTTINSGIVVSANSTSQYAFDTGTTFPAGTTLALINNGFVIGMGGSGGVTNGNPGGPALRAQSALVVTNNGTIGGGGGGGGAGLYLSSTAYGGGGRTGRTDVTSAGGSGQWAGKVGTFTAPGGSSANGGGKGGEWGDAGYRGYNYDAGASGYSGGAGGAAVVGNSNITWIADGTRYGSIT